MDWRNEYLIYAPEELTAPREPRWFESEKLVIQKISQRLTATYDSESFYCLDTLYVGLLNNANYNLKFILAILNSKLMDFYYKASFGAVHIGSNYLEYRTRYLDNLPIKPAPQAKQAELAGLVDNILEVNRQLPKLEAELTDFPGMVSRLGIPVIPLSASTGLVTANLAPVQGIPKLTLDGNRISLGTKATIEAADARYARYLWLYLSALKDDLRGKTPSEIVGLIKVPNSSDGVEMVLAKRASIEDQLADLRSRRLEIDKQIDSTVNELYVGAREIPTQSGLNSAS